MSARDNHDLREEQRDEQIRKLTLIHSADVRKQVANGDQPMLASVASSVTSDLANDALAQAIVRALAAFPDSDIAASLLNSVLERAIDAEAESLALADVERMERQYAASVDEALIEQANWNAQMDAMRGPS